MLRLGFNNYVTHLLELGILTLQSHSKIRCEISSHFKRGENFGNFYFFPTINDYLLGIPKHKNSSREQRYFSHMLQVISEKLT